MFEIGNSLREARLRQQLDFNEIERRRRSAASICARSKTSSSTCFRPRPTSRAFYGTTQTYLGLDGQLYVDEYNSRFVVGEDEFGLRPRRSAARQQRNRRLESNVVLVALAAIALVTALVIGAWKSAEAARKSPSSTLPVRRQRGQKTEAP